MSTLDERIRGARAAGDWAAVIALLDANWSSFMQGSRDVLRETLNALPAEVLEANARWVAAKDYVNFIPDSRTVRPVRYQHTASQPTGLLDVLAALTSRSCSDRFVGAFDRAVATVREAHSTIADVPREALVAIRPALAELRMQWAVTLELGGHLTDAVHGFERSYDEALVFDDLRIAAVAAGSAAFLHGLLGDRDEAERWLTRVPQIEYEGRDAGRIAAGLARVTAALDELDPDAARTALDQLPDDDVSPEHWAMRLYVESRYAVKFGDPRAQLVRLRAAQRSHLPALSQGGLNQWLLRCSEGTLLLAVGDARGSRAAVQGLVDSTAELAAESAAVVSAWAQLRSGEPARALAIAVENLAGSESIRTGAELWAVTAAALLQLEQPASAGNAFSTALRLVQQHCLYTVLTRLDDSEIEALTAATGVALPAPLGALRDRANRHSFPRRARAALTHRESVVLRHLVEGHSIDRIAELEHVSRNTIKTQMRSLFRKVEVTSRDEAVRLGLAHPELWAPDGV
ncbi:LuxR C-terminal-related transcriptional regulator [Herbiconiux sp. YIM B11900]|uniref:LuxR C-terminal-related transcriptional regulator n=1 Tax=Herbiconiux sp. YIM B11900 TaxID=3404131 RepID=UPI003F87F0BB